MSLFDRTYETLVESLVLKKKVLDSGNMVFVVDSNLEGPAASNETFKNKDKIKGTGLFFFDRTNLKKWISKEFTPEDFTANIIKYKKAVESINNPSGNLDSISDTIEELIEAGMQDKLKGFLNELKRNIKDSLDSEELKAFLEFRRKFHRYSFTNQMLIFLQKPNATDVAGKKKWETQFNRILKKGARGIQIFVPIKSKQEDPDNTGDDETKEQTRFILRPVFDISDTQPMEGKEDLVVSSPKWFDDSTPDESSQIIYDALLEFAKRKNISVTVGDDLNGARGISKGGSIALMQDNISTLIHEIAHELLHWTKDPKADKKILELQAEGVAYLVLRQFNLPYEHAAKYMALWDIDPENVRQNENIIGKTATEIIDFIYDFGSGEFAESFHHTFNKLLYEHNLIEESALNTLPPKDLGLSTSAQYLPDTVPYGFWVDRSGNFITVKSAYQHEQIAQDILKRITNITGRKFSGTGYDYMYAAGWLRVVCKLEYVEYTGVPPTQYQLRFLNFVKDLYNLKGLDFDRLGYDPTKIDIHNTI